MSKNGHDQVSDQSIGMPDNSHQSNPHGIDPSKIHQEKTRGRSTSCKVPFGSVHPISPSNDDNGSKRAVTGIQHKIRLNNLNLSKNDANEEMMQEYSSSDSDKQAKQRLNSHEQPNLCDSPMLNNSNIEKNLINNSPQRSSSFHQKKSNPSKRESSTMQIIKEQNAIDYVSKKESISFFAEEIPEMADHYDTFSREKSPDQDINQDILQDLEKEVTLPIKHYLDNKNALDSKNQSKKAQKQDKQLNGIHFEEKNTQVVDQIKAIIDKTHEKSANIEKTPVFKNTFKDIMNGNLVSQSNIQIPQFSPASKSGKSSKSNSKNLGKRSKQTAAEGAKHQKINENVQIKNSGPGKNGIIVQICHNSNTVNFGNDDSGLNSGLSCQEKLALGEANTLDINQIQVPQNIVKQESKTSKRQQKAAEGISNSRSKREVKKITPYDNSEYVLEDEPIDKNVKAEPGEAVTSNRQNRSRNSAANFQNGSKLTSAQAQKQQKISDSQDPFQLMFKHIMDPIILYDRLELLVADKIEFEILLKAKDFKSVKQERKEEMMSQRVHIEPSDKNFVIQIDMDPEFQRHTSQSASTQNRESLVLSKGDDEDNDASPLQVNDENNEEKNEDMEIDAKEDASPLDAETQFKKPIKKRGRKKQSLQTRKSQNNKWFNNYLPNSFSECTWLENTDFNIKLMDEKNKKIKAEREKRKSENKLLETQEIDKLMRENKAQVHFIQTKEYDKHQERSSLETGEIVSSEKKQSEQNESNEEEKNKEDQIDRDAQIDQNEVIKAMEGVIPVQVDEPKTEEIGAPTLVIEKDLEPEYVTQDNLSSIEQIIMKWRNNHYHSLDRLLEDLQFLVLNTIEKRCKNQLAKIYLTNFLINAQKVIRSKKREFLEKWVLFYNIRLNGNQFLNCIVGHGAPNVWYKKFDQSTKRDYFQIQNYKTKIPGEIEPTKEEHEKLIQENIDPHSIKKYTDKELKEIQRVQEIMQTDKKSTCNGECCTSSKETDDLKKQSNLPKGYNIDYQTFEDPPKCDCIKLKSECGPQCGCDPEKCTNRQMTLKQSLKFGIDVEERVTWGIDICTAVNFLTICPRDIPRPKQSNFIEKKLIYAVQQQNEQGYDVLRALKYIIEADLEDEILSRKFTQQDKEIASIMQDAIMNLPTKNTYHFRIHTKGVGIFCRKKNGIKKDSLVVEYFGELYRPWHWFEKQDVIKQGQNANKLPKDLPEFYNILFERHMDDPKGYNIMTVDPIIHGNYASRLSHSCVANCQTINKVRDKCYSIGMFTNKDILYGEELCFDYCSFTESEKEFEEAICLCGTEYCKGRYLNLANDKKNLAIMKNMHTFIDRNYILYKAITSPELTQEDNQRLYKNGLRSSCLDVAPLWLQKWASLICEYLEFEEVIYPEFFKDDFPGFKKEDIKLEAKMQKETQIQNIAITIDKIMHVLESMNTLEPPIRALTFKERYLRLWEENNSLKENVLDTIQKIEDCAQKEQAIIMLRDCDTIQMDFKPRESKQMSYISEEEWIFQQKYEKVRKVLADISAILRSVNSQLVAVPAFCDILMMYAYTETYFTQSEVYKKCKSDEVVIRKCDVRQGEGASMDKYSQGKQAYKGCKEYDSQYIWGQLVVWYKQTVDKPNASLSADRRGTLSIPDVQSFVVNPNKAQFENPQTQGPQKKRAAKKRGARESSQEILPTQGSKSRGIKPQESPTEPIDQVIAQPDQTQQLAIKKEESPQQKYLKIVYPSKRHHKREDFLQNWKETFSKQWDVCCAWSFQNKKKMYGSIQFESILKCDQKLCEQYKPEDGMTQEEKSKIYHDRYQAFIDQRLEYFDDTVKQLLKY